MSITIRTAAPTMMPPRMVLYGPPGVGKTTFAAGAPAPLFLPTEDGMGTLTASSITPEDSRVLRNVNDVHAALDVAMGDHAFKTLVLDSCTTLQEMVFDAVAKKNGVDTVADVPYGKGYPAALQLWSRILDRLDAVREQRKMAIIVIGHAQVEPFQDPEGQEYDRYSLRLHQQREGKPSLRATTIEWADMVGFANFRAYKAETGEGFNKRTVARGSGERVLYTSPHPARVAKSRYTLPEELDLDWATFFSAFKDAHSN